MAALIGGRRAFLASAGATSAAVVAGAGPPLRGVTPPADAAIGATAGAALLGAAPLRAGPAAARA